MNKELIQQVQEDTAKGETIVYLSRNATVIQGNPATCLAFLFSGIEAIMRALPEPDRGTLSEARTALLDGGINTIKESLGL